MNAKKKLDEALELLTQLRVSLIEIDDLEEKASEVSMLICEAYDDLESPSLQPISEEGIETLSEKIHKLYCEQYLEDNGKPYWTNGDYSKLTEQTKKYDRNIAKFILKREPHTRVISEEEIKKEFPIKEHPTSILEVKDNTIAEAKQEGAKWLLSRGVAKESVPSELNEIRKLGWSVAVHNDYFIKGKFHTFWLFTNPDGRYLKGEGETDKEALGKVLSMSTNSKESDKKETEKVKPGYVPCNFPDSCSCGKCYS